MDVKKYKKRPYLAVTAVQLPAPLEYEKWGGVQQGKKGDWLVDNDGDVYTIDQESFSLTYQAVSPGRYAKTAPVWASQVHQAGAVATKEGLTEHKEGDYVVSNNEDGTDLYTMSAVKFEHMYELAEE